MNLEQENYKNLTPFKFWTLTNFPFIEQTFDSLTNYELMCKLGEYLTNLEYNQNAVQNNMTNLYNYINNIDISDEVNQKLDKMAEDGTLDNILSSYINNNVNRIYNSLELLKIAELDENIKVQTLGYYSINDGGGATYIIRNTTPSGYYETLDNGKFAELIIKNNTINIKQIGAKCNNIDDDSSILIKSLLLADNIIVNNTLIKTDHLQLENINNKKLLNGKITLVFDDINNKYPIFTNFNNIEFNNIEFIGNNHASTMLSFNNSNSIIFNNCIIDGKGYNSGVRDNTKSNNGISFNTCKNVIVNNSIIKNIQYRYGIILTACSDFNITNNYFEYIGGSAIEMSNSNIKGFINNNKCYYCNITDLGQELINATDGVIDTYGKLDDLTDFNKDIIISNNIISYYGNVNIPNYGIRVSASKDIIVTNNIIKNKLTTNGNYMLIQDRNNNPASNVSIVANQFLCDDSNCFPGQFVIRTTGLNIKVVENIFDTIVNYTTVATQIIYIYSNVNDCEISNNKIGNQTNLTQGVCISNEGKNVKISNNILNTTYRAIICNNVDKCYINNNICNAGHNYAIQITGTSNNVKSFYNALTPANGVVKIEDTTTNSSDIGSFNWA